MKKNSWTDTKFNARKQRHLSNKEFKLDRDTPVFSKDHLESWEMLTDYGYSGTSNRSYKISKWLYSFNKRNIKGTL